MRTCNTCGVEKPLSGFYARAGCRDGVRPVCNDCIAEAAVYQRRASRLRIYGLTPETYDAMVAAQRGVCAICERPPTLNRSLAVDHDHDTGKVRGLLCVNCNQAIGMLQDSPDVLAAAAMYLLRSQNVLEGIRG